MCPLWGTTLCVTARLMLVAGNSALVVLPEIWKHCSEFTQNSRCQTDHVDPYNNLPVTRASGRPDIEWYQKDHSLNMKKLVEEMASSDSRDTSAGMTTSVVTQNLKQIQLMPHNITRGNRPTTVKIIIRNRYICISTEHKVVKGKRGQSSWALSTKTNTRSSPASATRRKQHVHALNLGQDSNNYFIPVAEQARGAVGEDLEIAFNPSDDDLNHDETELVKSRTGKTHQKTPAKATKSPRRSVAQRISKSSVRSKQKVRTDNSHEWPVSLFSDNQDRQFQSWKRSRSSAADVARSTWDGTSTNKARCTERKPNQWNKVPQTGNKATGMLSQQIHNEEQIPTVVSERKIPVTSWKIQICLWLPKVKPKNWIHCKTNTHRHRWC